MGGPLGAGDIEEVAGSTCIVCPWHYLKIDLKDGKKLSHKITGFDSTGRPSGFKWEKSEEVFQRVHAVRIEGGDVSVKIGTEPLTVQSDRFCKHAAAARGLTASRSGEDGKRLRY
jgi:nitrite reductase/ring-hydroxylating ferredoxin subunit